MVALAWWLAACAASGTGQAVHERQDALGSSTTPGVPIVAMPPPRGMGALAPADRLRRVRLAVAGDVLVHRAVWESAAAHAGGAGFDFGPMFAALRPAIEVADLALCHLEVPLSADNADLSTYPRFNAPFQLADGLAAAGFDGCSVASNHVLDQGVGGIDSTLGHLDRVGLGHAGAARTPEEAAALTWYDVRGVSIAHLSYTYGYNGLRPPSGEDWRSNLNSVPAIVAEAARARAEGADLVLLSIHWGDEYVADPNQAQRDLAAAIDAQSEVDLVIGHHAHVIQPVGQVGETPVLFGLGNLLSNMGQIERREGVVVTATFEAEPGDRFGLTGIVALPTFVQRPGHFVVPAPADSWARSMARLGSEGVPVAPWPQ